MRPDLLVRIVLPLDVASPAVALLFDDESWIILGRVGDELCYLGLSVLVGR
jgi:hypothetical protein